MRIKEEKMVVGSARINLVKEVITKYSVHIVPKFLKIIYIHWKLHENETHLA